MNARLRAFPFAFAFGLAGIGSALLGATLPATLHDWHLDDSQGGLLLFATWGGSTAGAFFARGTSGASAVLGLALSAAELFWLSIRATHLPIVHFFLYGLGLGMAMTAISLKRAHDVAAVDADIELNRLNLLWAAGAFLTPVLALHSLRLLSVAQFFRALSGILLCTAIALFASFARKGTESRTQIPKPPYAELPWAPLGFCLFAAASVGLESAIGSWLTTYVDRSHLGLAAAVSANTCFWGGLLLSRALHSISRAQLFHTPTARTAHIAATGLALALLTLLPSRIVLPAAGLLCGFGLGPLYPYVLSVALPRFRSTAVFVSAGIGAATVPWFTGILSNRYGSLRLGLLACLASFLVLAATAFHLRHKLA